MPAEKMTLTMKKGNQTSTGVWFLYRVYEYYVRMIIIIILCIWPVQDVKICIIIIIIIIAVIFIKTEFYARPSFLGTKLI